MLRKKILILGSEGFIGSHTVKYFTKGDYIVFKADIVLKQEKNYYLINPEASDFRSIFLSQEFDLCINATGAANVQLSFSHPDLDYTLNTANVYNILNCIRLYSPLCKFINLSSAAVYGNPLKLPVTENTLLNPLSPYGFHKLFSELICNEFYKLFKINTISLRVFSAYGPGLKKQIFWDLFEKTKESNRIEILGTGKESRDFVYVEDISRSFEFIFEKVEFYGQAINLGSEEETSIKTATEYFLKLIDPSIEFLYSGTTKIGDPINWVSENTTLKGLGFNTNFKIEDGLNNTAKWLKGLK